MSRVSVIIATYNYGHYLGDALLSLKNQTFKDWECIIVDDGSTDNTQSVAQSFISEDLRITYVKQNNQGVSSARNTGLALAKGEFIQFLDADDMLQPMKLEMQVNYLTAHTESNLVFSDFIHVQDAAEINALKGELPQTYKRELNADEFLETLVRANFVRINTVLLRAVVIKQVGVFHAELRSVEDWDFWIRCAANGNGYHFVTAEKSHAVIRTSSTGLSKDTKTMKRHYVAVLQRLYYSGKVAGTIRFMILMRASFFVSLFWLSNQPTDFDKECGAGFKWLTAVIGILLLPVVLLYRIKVAFQ